MHITSSEWKDLIASGAVKMGLGLTSRQIEQLAIHARSLMLWQKKVNLTAIKKPEEVAVKHYLDSLAPATLIPANALLMDMGSGGGFPGIPLKVYHPSLRVTLIDSSRKKVNFLRHVTREMSLKDLDIMERRLEALPSKGEYDVIVSRALSGLETLVKLAWPMLSEHGIMIFHKGKDIDEELRGARELVLEDGPTKRTVKDLLSFRIINYTLPFLNLKRSLVTIRPYHGSGERGRHCSFRLDA